METNPYETPETMGHEQKEVKKNGFKLLHLLGGLAIICVLIALLLPLRRHAGPATYRMSCENHLRHIAVGLMNYENTYGCLPPAYTLDEEGKPLHSWRTLILPFIEENWRYQKIDLSKPWDDPVNEEAFADTPRAYLCPAEKFPPGRTGYLAVVAPGGCFAGSAPRKLSEITDGTARTITVIEVPAERSVPWMLPQDADEDTILSLTTDKRHPHPGGVNVVFADGSTQFVRSDIKPEALRAMITIDGND